MKSSYNGNLNFGDLIKSLTYSFRPRKIVEFGILEGFSLQCFVDAVPANCLIEAYDIFDDFNGNHAIENDVKEQFAIHKNVKIAKMDFYKGSRNFEDNSIDILHVDIANNGNTYQHCIENYASKLSDNGILILEGGSPSRDSVEWMVKYSKRPINPYLQELQMNGCNVCIIDRFPSLTIIRKDEINKCTIKGREYTVRHLTKNDYIGYSHLLKQLTRVGDVDEEKFRNVFDQLKLGSIVIVVEDDNKRMIGTAKLMIEQKVHNECAKMGHIEDVVTDEGSRGMGIGKFLIEYLIKYSEKNGCYKTVLNCDETNILFYEKCGLRKKGVEMCKYKNSDK